MTDTQNTTQETKVYPDFFSWFYETMHFNDDDLNKELIIQEQKIIKDFPEEADVVEIAMADQNTRTRCKKVLVELCMLYTGASVIANDEEWATFEVQWLEKCVDGDHMAKLVRESIMLYTTPDEARDEIRKQTGANIANQEEVRKAQMRFDLRLDGIIEAYKKAHA